MTALFTKPIPQPLDIELDHVGFIVPDLEAARELLAQLGFTLTARANHTRTDAHGALVSAGSSQHSIMLGNGYVEIMQITDPAAGHQLALAPTARYGVHVVAFGTADASDCHAGCVRNGVPAGPVLHWARQINEGVIRGTALFAYFGSTWQPTDPSYLCWVEHRTPGLLRSPQLLRHDNHALGLVALCYRGPQAQARQWSRQLLAAGMRLVREREDGIDLSLPNATLQIDFDEQQTSVLPSALVFELSDGTWLRERCAALGLGVRVSADGAFDVDLVAQLGVHCIFRPHNGEVN